MTSLLTFKIDNGNQLIVVGDMRHTFASSTFESTKFFFFNGLLFCGAGYDRIILDLLAKVNSMRNQVRCSNKLLKLKREKMREYREQGSGSDEEVKSCDFFIIDTSTLVGSKIYYLERTSMASIELMGSGSEHIGRVQEILRGCEVSKFDDSRKDLILRKILEIYRHLGKHDPFTGHPAIFNLDVYVLEVGVSPRKYKISFTPSVEDSGNYSFEVQND